MCVCVSVAGYFFSEQHFYAYFFPPNVVLNASLYIIFFYASRDCDTFFYDTSMALTMVTELNGIEGRLSLVLFFSNKEEKKKKSVSWELLFNDVQLIVTHRNKYVEVNMLLCYRHGEKKKGIDVLCSIESTDDELTINISVSFWWLTQQ